MGMSSGDNRSLPCGIVSSIHMGGGGDIQLSLVCPEFIFKNFCWEREGSERRYFHWYLQKTGVCSLLLNSAGQDPCETNLNPSLTARDLL